MQDDESEAPLSNKFRSRTRMIQCDSRSKIKNCRSNSTYISTTFLLFSFRFSSMNESKQSALHLCHLLLVSVVLSMNYLWIKYVLCVSLRCRLLLLLLLLLLLREHSSDKIRIETHVRDRDKNQSFRFELGFGDIWPCNPIQPNWESEKTDAMNEKKAGNFFLWNQK